MSQRVNISYSVELDELDVEVQRLIKKSLIEVQGIVDECNNIDQEAALVIKNCEVIDSIRRKMAKADLIFGDAINIINGYINFKTAPSVDTADTTQNDMSALKDKIEKFKDSIEQNSDLNEITD